MKIGNGYNQLFKYVFYTDPKRGKQRHSLEEETNKLLCDGTKHDAV